MSAPKASAHRAATGGASMTEPRRRRSTRKPRRVRGFDVTKLCLALAAVLAAVPWLFPMSFDPQPVSQTAGQAAAERAITDHNHHGAAR
jgi:hypothetical protein